MKKISTFRRIECHSARWLTSDEFLNFYLHFYSERQDITHNRRHLELVSRFYRFLSFSAKNTSLRKKWKYPSFTSKIIALLIFLWFNDLCRTISLKRYFEPAWRRFIRISTCSGFKLLSIFFISSWSFVGLLENCPDDFGLSDFRNIRLNGNCPTEVYPNYLLCSGDAKTSWICKWFCTSGSLISLIYTVQVIKSLSS